jgi:hypothetical protein
MGIITVSDVFHNIMPKFAKISNVLRKTFYLDDLLIMTK